MSTLSCYLNNATARPRFSDVQQELHAADKKFYSFVYILHFLCIPSSGGCLIVQPMMLQHRVSGTAKMTCVLEGSICSNVNWIGPALTAGPSSRIVKSGHFQASLTINDLRIRDLGSYSCVCGENRSPPALLEVFSKSIIIAIITQL